MSDTETLLKKTSKLSHDDYKDNNDNESNRQLSTIIFSNWRQFFGNKDEKLDDGTENSNTNELVGVLDLFRFADRIDRLLMFITACFLLLHSSVLLASYVILGRLAGLFAIESFDNSCYYQHQNSTAFNTNNHSCPLGIELNSSNYDRLHKLCRNTDVIVSSTTTILIPLFRTKVMNLVHWLFIIGPIEFVAIMIIHFIWTLTAKRQTSRMSVRLFQSLIQRNISYLDKNPTSQLNSKLFDNIAKIEQGIGFEFLILASLLFESVSTIVVALFINWKLTLVMVCLIPIVIVGTSIFSKASAFGTANELNTYAKAEQIVQEVFSSVRTVLSLNGNKFEQKRYERELHETRLSSIRQGAIYGIFVGWTSFISYIVYAVGFIFGSILISYINDNTINISDILVIVFMFAQSMTYFSFTGCFIESFSKARGAAVSVFRLIDEIEESDINEFDICKDIEFDTKCIDINGDIEFKNVNFVYPSRINVSVLHNLNLIARAGQTTALVGSSGCGKSTCISLLIHLYEISSGYIIINGRSISDYNLRQLRQNIGVVSQEPILFDMSIYENIQFGKLNATRKEIEEAAQQANAHNFIMELPNKYSTIVGERGIQLSGGEKQRIALARALVKQPTLLLLDEATSALDNVNEKIVQEALDRACQNRTTIIIAHRLSTIENVDKIYVLDNGNVIEEGTHTTLMEKQEGKYKIMVKSQKIEELYDNKDDIISIDKIEEKERKQISEYSHLLSDSQTIDMHKKSSLSSNQRHVFLRLLSMNSPEWIIILIGCITCLLNGLVQPISAVLLAKLVEIFKDCILSERHRRVLISSLLFLLLGVLVLIFRFLQYTTFSISGSKLTQRIRSKTFACLLRQEIGYFDQPQNNSGAISARLSSESLSLQQITGTRLGVLCESFSLTFFGLLFGFLFNWELTLIIFIPIIFYFIICFLHVNIGIWHNKRSSLILNEASSFAIEVLNNMRTIKQLSVEKKVLERYSQYMHKLFIISVKLFLSNGITFGISFVLNPYISAFLYWRALVLVEHDKIKSSDIIILFSFSIFALQSVKTVEVLCKGIGVSVSAAQSFFDLFDRIPIIDNSSTEGLKLTDFHGNIEFDKVDFVYPSRPTYNILNKFQLNIKQGQRVALVGSSGCGKSTIIQLLERFYDVTHGQLFLDGIDIRQLNIQWIRSCFGLVSQEPILFDLTIAENIAYGLENISMEDIINAAIKANIHYFIQQLPQSYETRVGMKGNFLSGGEKQRIAIARVLLRKPKVLLLDEATSAMDSYNEQIIQQTLEQTQKENPNRTSLIIAHRLSTISYCDLICIIDKGYIVESGTHAELMQRRGNYYRIVVNDNL